MLVNADHLAEALAYGAGTDRRVEREHLIVRLLKSDAVRFEFRTEII